MGRGWTSLWESRWPPWAREALTVGLLVLGLLAAGVPTPSAAEPSASTVILISLDGTRPADLIAENVPALDAFARRWARATRLVASVPTNTFPNHVTLVTGVEPQHHGLVNNAFRDPRRGVFDRHDIHTWLEVEPLWSLLERVGIATASFHWVGSEGPFPGGHAPRHWMRFSSATPAREKVEQILDWLDLPPERGRPRFISSWMHGADHAGHVHGPGSPAVRERLRAQDPALGRLIEGIAERALWAETTLLFVSDHGMAGHAVTVDVTAVLEAAGIAAEVYGIGGFASVVLEARSGREPELVERALTALRAAGLESFARDGAPAEAAVGHPRFGDLVVRAPVGTAIVYAGLELEGFHGYPPDAPAMAAILIAGGRGVGRGVDLGVVHGLDVAPTVLALLGQPIPPWMQGRPIGAIVPGAGASATLSPPDGPAGSPSSFEPEVSR